MEMKARDQKNAICQKMNCEVRRSSSENVIDLKDRMKFREE